MPLTPARHESNGEKEKGARDSAPHAAKPAAGGTPHAHRFARSDPPPAAHEPAARAPAGSGAKATAHAEGRRRGRALDRSGRARVLCPRAEDKPWHGMEAPARELSELDRRVACMLHLHP
jgi:hypothetical protein